MADSIAMLLLFLEVFIAAISRTICSLRRRRASALELAFPSKNALVCAAAAAELLQPVYYIEVGQHPTIAVDV